MWKGSTTIRSAEHPDTPYNVLLFMDVVLGPLTVEIGSIPNGKAPRKLDEDMLSSSSAQCTLPSPGGIREFKGVNPRVSNNQEGKDPTSHIGHTRGPT